MTNREQRQKNKPRAGQFPPKQHGIFCNRTLNLRSMRAIGYDMDYTLVQYKVREWEHCAFGHIKTRLLERNWPVQPLEFDPDLVIRGLVIDTELGNIVKANRFGYVKQALHGTRFLTFEEQREVYARTTVDLSESRYRFINTLFALSETCMYAQLVDLLDQRKLPGALGYRDVYETVRESVDTAHMEGLLKAQITANPDRFVERDPDIPLTLLDQRHAGKKLILITNSEWEYTDSMMSYAIDSFLDNGMTWRNLFDLVIISARKPQFFTSRNPAFEIVNEEGLLKPSVRGYEEGKLYVGGDAGKVEDLFGVDGDQILFVGDHMYSDVKVSKSLLRWRTALVLRELEDELSAHEEFKSTEKELSRLMARKEKLEFEQAHYRLALVRKRGRYGPPVRLTETQINERLTGLRDRIAQLDQQISPLAARSATMGNRHWGPLMHAGNDKSHLARQIERYADIYTSRVSNFLYHTPFQYLRSPRGTLPHDTGYGVL